MSFKMTNSVSSSFVDLGRSVTNASPPSKVVMKHFKCVQLEKGNYYSWEAQFSSILRGLGLIDYVEGNVDLQSLIANQQDQLILS